MLQLQECLLFRFITQEVRIKLELDVVLLHFQELVRS